MRYQVKVLPIQPLFLPLFVSSSNETLACSLTLPLFYFSSLVTTKCVQNKLKSVFSLFPILHFIIVYDYTNCKQHFATCFTSTSKFKQQTPVENQQQRRQKDQNGHIKLIDTHTHSQNCHSKSTHSFFNPKKRQKVKQKHRPRN